MSLAENLQLDKRESVTFDKSNANRLSLNQYTNRKREQIEKNKMFPLSLLALMKSLQGNDEIFTSFR